MASDFSTVFQSAFRDAVASVLKLSRSSVAIKGYRNTPVSSLHRQSYLQSALQLQVDYTVAYLATAPVPSVATIASALTGNNNGTTVGSLFKTRLLQSFQGNVTLQALVSGISVSPPMVALITKLPSSAPTAPRSAASAASSSDSGDVTLIYVLSAVGGVIALCCVCFCFFHRIRAFIAGGHTRPQVAAEPMEHEEYDLKDVAVDIPAVAEDAPPVVPSEITAS